MASRRILVIGGSPGSGKTSVAHLLAEREELGVHIEADLFYRFIAHRIDPSVPEAHEQNRTIVRAFSKTALEFSERGHRVFLEGVIGPWMLPIISEVLPAYDYVLLDVELDSALARIALREGQPSATLEVVRRMHPQFVAARRTHGHHLVGTDGRKPGEIAEQIRQSRQNGDLAICGR